jgi:hypothetical protein
VTLGAAVIGLGVGEQHARALAAHPGTHVAWLCDLELERADGSARRSARQRHATDG